MFSFAESLFNQNGISGFAILAGGVLILLAAGYYLQGPKSKFPLPPGPKGSPIIGNIRQLSPGKSEIQFMEWTKEYNSDVLYVNLLGQHVIILNSVKSAVDLLVKKGAYYSNRPPMILMEALGFHDNVSLLSDGAQFRKLRKAFGNLLSARSSLAHRDTQLKNARTMAAEIERNPEDWTKSISRFSTRVIFSVAFGIEIADEADPYFALAEKMGMIISNAGNVGISLLDIVPWLQYAPRWMGNFITSIKFVNDNRPTTEEFIQRPFDAVMKRFKSGTMQPSFIGHLVETREMHKEDEEKATQSFTDDELLGSGGVLYAAGQDTSFSTIMSFVMGMVLAPKVQIQAQQEIDAITGGTRMPTFQDWNSLPIIERIVNECLRFHPPAPNGVPHKTLREDVYRDMYIPKGSMVIANSWAMLQDPEIYKNPGEFNPNRFLPVSEGGGGEPLPVGQFGFGRRICPGQYLALASLWIAAATILAKFNISPTKDEDEQDIMPKVEFSTGITSHPVPFSCVFTPRSVIQ